MSNYSIIITDPAQKENSLKLDLLELKKAAVILRALNHKLRQQIIKEIDEQGKITVTDLYIKLRLEQSVASQHLAILRKAGIVTTLREGKYIYYSLNMARLEDIMRYTTQLLN
ncbi:MAG: ArsR/SmtB family transcription factor [Chitinophagaceae bacterium]